MSGNGLADEVAYADLLSRTINISLSSLMEDGRAKQLQVYAEDRIQVQDHGRSATPFPRALSQYLSADISARLINSSAPRTLAVIDQEILSVSAIIESLRILQILKSRTRNGCAPISRLPLEILAEIFITCLECDDSTERERDAEVDLRLILGQVCSVWRSVAWGLPMLWTTVHCRVPDPKKSKKIATLLLQWLRRARDLPISVKIDFLDEEAWAKLGTNAPIDILDALIPFCHTWKVLDLVLPESWQRHLNVFNSWRFVSLEELHIRPPALMQDTDVDMEGFLGAPKLCSVFYHSYALQRLSLTWANLTHGTFGGPSLNEAVELLSRCTNLITCHISDLIPDDQIQPVPSIFHSCLQELRIEFRPAGPAPPVATIILNLLTVPMLRNISLTLPLHHANPLPDILELIERSRCPLKVVEVFGPTISQDLVVDFLSESSVTHVHNG